MNETADLIACACCMDCRAFSKHAEACQHETTRGKIEPGVRVDAKITTWNQKATRVSMALLSMCLLLPAPLCNELNAQRFFSSTLFSPPCKLTASCRTARCQCLQSPCSRWAVGSSPKAEPDSSNVLSRGLVGISKGRRANFRAS